MIFYFLCNFENKIAMNKGGKSCLTALQGLLAFVN